MGVEIGTLVLTGTFGAAPTEATGPEARARDHARALELDRFRAQLLREVDDKLDEAARRARER